LFLVRQPDGLIRLPLLVLLVTRQWSPVKMPPPALLVTVLKLIVL